MSKKRKESRRGLNFLLQAHLLLYLIAWCLALYYLSMLPMFSFTADYTHFIAIVMLWLPFLALHVIVHITSMRQGVNVADERQAYRDGFADAVQQLAHRPDLIERLALDDDSEWVEIEEKPKRDHG